MGFNLGALSFSYTSRVLRISCLSLTRLSNPIRSTGLNQVPLPIFLRALITHTSDPCVTALLNTENLSLGFLCPVLSRKEYTAMVMGGPSRGGVESRIDCMGERATSGSLHFLSFRLPAQPANMKIASSVMSARVIVPVMA